MADESSGNNLRECDGKVGGKRKRKRKVGLLYDERMCKHDTPDGEDHPECPDRIRVIWEKLQATGLAQRCEVLGGSKAEDKHLQLVHTKDHIKKVKHISTKKKDSRRNRIASELNSIYLNGGSSEAAYLAAGSVVEVAEKVAEGELDCGFAIVRPPGHHAEADEAMGFCLFNNVAVAASYLLNERPDLGIKKILIVDWDVHHGNGTQKMFWEDPRVLVFSVHRHDFGSFYPTGDDGDYNMVGEGPGEGFNINVPWEQEGCGDSDYLVAWDDILIPVTKEFNPDIILLSAGFDAAIGDPLGGCCVTPYGYSVMLKKLMEFAQGKIVMALEGGYNLDSVAKSSLACVQVLLEDKPIEGSPEEYPFESTGRVIQAVRKRLCAYWPSLADDQKSPTPTDCDFEMNHEVLGQMFELITENHQDTTSVMPRLESLLKEAFSFKSPPQDDEEIQSISRGFRRSVLEMFIQGVNLIGSSVRSKLQAETLRGSLELALEEKEALHTRAVNAEMRVAELQEEAASYRLRLQVSREKYAAEAKEAAEHLAQARSELREVQIDLNVHRELLQKADEERKSLQGRIIELGAQLQEEASYRLRLRVSRDKYAVEAEEAAEHLAQARSGLREVQIDLSVHRKLLQKEGEEKKSLQGRIIELRAALEKEAAEKAEAVKRYEELLRDQSSPGIHIPFGS